jgi:hypothetical protein
MRKTSAYYISMAVIVVLFAGSSAHAGEWRFPIGFSYVNGLTDVRSDYRNNLEAQGYSVDDDTTRPFGISLQPYVQFDNGFGIGGAIGPYLSIQSPIANFYAVPVGLDVRYMFTPNADSSAYVRVGGRYNVAGGKFVEHSTPGLFGAIGYEFFRKKTVGTALELAYDTSNVTLKNYQNSTNYNNETVRPSAFMASVFVIFSFDNLNAK